MSITDRARQLLEDEKIRELEEASKGASHGAIRAGGWPVAASLRMEGISFADRRYIKAADPFLVWAIIIRLRELENHASAQKDRD